MAEPLIASNPDNQERLDRLVREGRGWTCDCGAPLFSEDECAVCLGSDPYGGIFCPVEQYCCGC